MLSFLEAVLALTLASFVFSATLKLQANSLAQINLLREKELAIERDLTWKSDDLLSASCIEILNSFSQRFLKCKKHDTLEALFLLE